MRFPLLYMQFITILHWNKEFLNIKRARSFFTASLKFQWCSAADILSSLSMQRSTVNDLYRGLHPIIRFQCVPIPPYTWTQMRSGVCSLKQVYQFPAEFFRMKGKKLCMILPFVLSEHYSREHLSDIFYIPFTGSLFILTIPVLNICISPDRPGRHTVIIGRIKSTPIAWTFSLFILAQLRCFPDFALREQERQAQYVIKMSNPSVLHRENWRCKYSNFLFMVVFWKNDR